MTNSLYTNREIFLRELLSSASDALDKARFQGLVDSNLRDRDAKTSHQVHADEQSGVLVIEDNGIGMTATRSPLTSAPSPTPAPSTSSSAPGPSRSGQKPDLNLISQFGVGFYSAFMVADRIDVYTLSAVPSTGRAWAPRATAPSPSAPANASSAAPASSSISSPRPANSSERYRLGAPSSAATATT
ncbi:hypothetical protein [Nannocystis sp.]|uniref:hypothetical protein n=1 Tax=Nannocystis sp. TaxID=1962667 RepID=UPI0025F1D595|nr:hypothetical protein [Nannocystis sp.]MBK7830550.1 hypothetical protein [Nannocystis sp.]